MGSSASKVSRLAGTTATKRKYPQRVPPASSSSSPPTSAGPPPHRGNTPSPTSHPNLQASTSKTEAINLDGSGDPTFAQSLRTLGPVIPSSTLSNSSTVSSPPPPSHHHQQPSTSSFPQLPSNNNPALQILAARSRLAADAERDFARAARVSSSGSSGDDDDDDGAQQQQEARRGGRRFVDVDTLRRVLDLRDRQQLPAEAIERKLGLERGVVGVLGSKGVVGGAEGPV